MKHKDAETCAPARSIYNIPAVEAQVNNNNNNELRDNFDDNGFTFARGTPIQDFYAGQKIFITGGTGFLGKILIEKLLRSCPNVSTIYMLIRTKKDKPMEDRIEELFNNPIYDQLREVLPKFRHKIVGISGDCCVPGFGLSTVDRELLLREVSIVFHGAATVRFDEKLDVALAINTGSTREILELCHRMIKLKAFIHVSTAYAYSNRTHIDEKFYPHPSTYEELVKSMEGLSDREIGNLTPKILGKWPNTYTYTKALAEIECKDRSHGLCMGIFRPGVVISCAREPTPGWTDNFYGPTGAVSLVASGILRTMQFGRTSKANVIPVDMCVNALIASAWDVANQPDRKEEDMLIYNYCSAADQPVTWIEYCNMNIKHVKDFPFSCAKWTVGLMYPTNDVIGVLSRIYLHYLPALIVDFIRICSGKRPERIKMWKKINIYLNAVHFFYTNDWVFGNINVGGMWRRLNPKDQNIFHFNICDVVWDDYFRDYMRGMKVYLHKEDLSTLEASKKQARRYQMMHRTMKAGLYVIIVLILWKIVSAIFF